MRQHWGLAPEITFLNHGSFGACPTAVLAAQQQWRARMERQPVDFFATDWWGLIDAARARVAAFVGADPAGLVFVRNATEAVNAALHAVPLQPGDEVLVTDHTYAACRFALNARCAQTGARVVTVTLPFPVALPAGVEAAVLGAVTPRTRLALIDHITSPTGLVLPIASLVAALEGQGVPTLVDGAHGPGMVPLALDDLGASFYAANCHKWLCAPKGAGFLWVRPAWRDHVRPVVRSHGAGIPLPAGVSRLHAEFDWPGTVDPSAWLSVPAAIDWVARTVPGGWPAAMARSRALVLRGRALVCEAVGVPVPDDAPFIASLATVPLPPGPPAADARQPDPLNRALRAEGIEVPVVPWPATDQRLLRLSAALYNTDADYEHLAAVLPRVLAREGGGAC